jgi:hypothetical protein
LRESAAISLDAATGVPVMRVYFSMACTVLWQGSDEKSTIL